MVHIILLSGGSGKRLWPLSNDSRAKQFIKLLVDENGNRQSMLQRIYKQIKSASLNADLTVAVSPSQVDTVRNQIDREVHVVVEPNRKNTYPAIALSCAYLKKMDELNPMDVIIAVPVDPYVDMDFFSMLPKIAKLVETSDKSIVLMGVEPTYPSAKYGYINVGREEDGIYEVSSFLEKPTEKEAQKLISMGSYWSTGVFAFRPEFIMNHVVSDIGVFEYDELVKRYTDFENISFDYKILERTDNMAMLPYLGSWKDIGTWNTLTEEMSCSCVGEGMQGEYCENTHIINELSIPIVALGLKNVVIAASPDGILVSDKNKSSYLKPYVDKIDNRPMFEERKWGEYKVLDYVQYADKTQSLTKHLIIEKGKSISYQSHHLRDEIWIIVDGVGELLLDGVLKKVMRGDTVYIEANKKHAIRAQEDIHFIEVQIGSELVEEDIERYEWKWL